MIESELKKYHGKMVTVETDGGETFTGICHIYYDTDDDDNLYTYIMVDFTCILPKEIKNIRAE